MLDTEQPSTPTGATTPSPASCYDFAAYTEAVIPAPVPARAGDNSYSPLRRIATAAQAIPVEQDPFTTEKLGLQLSTISTLSAN